MFLVNYESNTSTLEYTRSFLPFWLLKSFIYNLVNFEVDAIFNVFALISDVILSLVVEFFDNIFDKFTLSRDLTSTPNLNEEGFDIFDVFKNIIGDIYSRSASYADNKLILVEASFNNIKLNSVLVDSGASSSIISTYAAKKYGFRFRPCSVKMRVADDREVPVEGITDLTIIKIRNTECLLKLLVFENNHFDAILGMDFFVETGAVIDPKKKRLWFPGEKWSN